MSFWDRLKGTLGFASVLGEERARLPRPDPDGRVIGPLPLYLQLQRIGGPLTPQTVTEILRLADVGYMYRLVDLGNEARQRDCHLQSTLFTRECAIAGLEWQVLPPDGPRKKDRKAADFVAQALRACLDFPDTIAHLTGAAYPGYAVAESLFEKTGRQEIVPRGFERHSARRFVFEQTAGRLQQWDAAGGGLPYPGFDFRAEYPGKFVVHQPRIVGDVPNREGLVRPLMWAALFRNWSVRDWLELAELAWKPWRTAKYKKKEFATTADIDGLMTLLQRMVSTGVCVYPDSAELEVHWPAQSTTTASNHAQLIDVMGREMSKCVLGQTETTEASKSSGYAQAKIHNEVRRDILEADARSVATAIRRDLIAPLVAMNFGDTVEVPHFAFITKEGVALTDFATGVKTLAKDAGLPVPRAWVYATAGIPEPDEDEDVIGGESVDIPIDPATGLPEEPPIPEDEDAPPPAPEEPKKAA